jgi:murein DD-endopeptidase MepM/ murein hydrolase activator NlpD
MSTCSVTKQAWRSCASLLFIFVAACASPAPTPTATQLPTAALAASNTPDQAAGPMATEPAAMQGPSGEIQTYIVEPGDTLTSIAAQFGLQPQTVLWANYNQLFDVTDFLMPGMQLTILPIDGVYHQVGGGDNVENIAAFFASDAQAIIDWEGNAIDANNPVIFAGQWLLVPGGQRAQRNRTMPDLPAYAMAASPLEFGSGACPQNSQRVANASGEFAWPVSSHTIAGDGYSDIHPGIDVSVGIGEPVLAADEGVVVYSGWSNFGYGQVTMLDHGNGDFTLYAGLSSATAVCGALVSQGQHLGTGGVTGHPASPFVHFEARRGGENIDPLSVLP